MANLFMISAAARMLVAVPMTTGQGDHHGMDPDVVDVLPVRDSAGNVSLRDDAYRMIGPYAYDHESGLARVLHQVSGGGRVVVLVHRRHRLPRDIRDGGRGR